MRAIFLKMEKDPSETFENLVKYTFKCKRLEDPHDICSSDFYNGEFCPNLTEIGHNSLKIILSELIKNESNTKDLVELRLSLNTTPLKQINALYLIKYIIDIIKENNKDI